MASIDTRLRDICIFDPIRIRVEEFTCCDAISSSELQGIEHEQYGISQPKLFHLSLRGMKLQEIQSIRSMFQSFDEDNSGSLTPDEVQSALSRYGLSISPQEFEAVMEAFDTDKSGSLGFEEVVELFLFLKASSSSQVSHRSSFDACYMADAAAVPDEVPLVLEIPRSSFDPQWVEETREATLQLNLEFERFAFIKIDQNRITLPVKIVQDSWIEKSYRYDSKVSTDQSITFHFQERYNISSNIRKIKCVKFPGDVKQGPDLEGVQGFPVLSSARSFLQVGFQAAASSVNLSHLAGFSDAPAYLSTLEASAGTTTQELGKIVARACLLPSWYPFTFSYRVKGASAVKASYKPLESHLGEIDEAEGVIDVKVVVDMQRLPQAITSHFTTRHPWLQGMSSLKPAFLNNDIVPVHIGRLGRSEAKVGLRIIPRTMRTLSSSARWLACPSHVNVLHLIMPVSSCMFLVDYHESVSLRAFRRSLKESPLSPSQQSDCILVLAWQLAAGLEHVHDHAMMHLDVKPDNVLLAISDRVSESLLDFTAKLCDFSSSMCLSDDDATKRGTPGFWSPEQVHNPLSASSGGQACFWKEDDCVDPPLPSDHAPSQLSDSWGWATTVLYAMGVLEDMKKLGYSAFQRKLYAQGYDVDLSLSLLADAHQDVVQRRSRQAAEEANQRQVQAELSLLEDECARASDSAKLMWQEATESLKRLDKKNLKQASMSEENPRIASLKHTLRIILQEAGKTNQQPHMSIFTEEVLRELIAHNPADSLHLSDSLKRSLDKLNAAANDTDPQPSPAILTYSRWIATLVDVHRLSHRSKEMEASMAELEGRRDDLSAKMRIEEASIASLEEALSSEQVTVREHTSQLMQVILTGDKSETVAYLQQLLRRDFHLPEEAYSRLRRDLLYCTGEHAVVMRGALSNFNSQQHEDSLRARDLSGSAPDDQRPFDDLSSFSRDFPFLQGEPVPSEVRSLERQVEAAFTRFASSPDLASKLAALQRDTLNVGERVKHAVGDILKLLLLWCLQYMPAHRPPVRTVRFLLSQVLSFKRLRPSFSPLSTLSSQTLTMEILRQAPSNDETEGLLRLALQRTAADHAQRSDHVRSLQTLQELVARHEAREESEEKNVELTGALLSMSTLLSSLPDLLASSVCLDLAIEIFDRLYANATRVKSQGGSRRMERLKFDVLLAKTSSCLTRSGQEKLDERVQAALQHLSDELHALPLNPLDGAQMLAQALAVAAELKEAEGRYEAALRLNKLSLQASLVASGQYGYLLDPCAAMLAHRIASLHTTLGDFAEADAYLYRALSSQVLQDSAASRRSLVQTLLLAASSHKLRHDLKLAHTFLQLGLSEASQQLDGMRERLGGMQGPEMWSLRAKILHELGEFDKSLSDWNKAFTVCRHLLAFKSPVTGAWEDHSPGFCARCLVGMGDSLLGMRAGWKAVEKYQMARELMSSEAAEGLTDLRASICERLGEAHVGLGNIGIALEWFSDASSTRRRLQGKSHPARLPCLVWLARLHGESLTKYKEEAQFILRGWSSCGGLGSLAALGFLLEYTSRIFEEVQQEISLLVLSHHKLLDLSAAAKSRAEEAKRQVEEKLVKLKSVRRLPAVEAQVLAEATRSYQEGCREEADCSNEVRRLKHKLMLSRATLSKKEDEVERVIELYQHAVKTMRLRAPKAIMMVRKGEEKSEKMREQLRKLQESFT